MVKGEDGRTAALASPPNTVTGGTRFVDIAGADGGEKTIPRTQLSWPVNAILPPVNKSNRWSVLSSALTNRYRPVGSNRQPMSGRGCFSSRPRRVCFGSTVGMAMSLRQEFRDRARLRVGDRDWSVVRVEVLGRVLAGCEVVGVYEVVTV